MKKPFLLFIFLLFIIFNVKGQNLVPNGDFEQYSGCPTNYAQFDSLLFWINITDSVYYYGSPDYFNQCSGASNVGVPSNIFGFQQAHSGLGYSGAVLKYVIGVVNFREYLEVPLSSTLIAGNCYYFEMYLSVSENSGYTTDDIGVYFSDTLFSHVNNYFPLPCTPQISNAPGNFPDTLNWTLVSGNYTATGGENYLLIGNFLDDVNTNTILVNNNPPYNSAYVFIDDVSLTTCTGIEEQNQNDGIKIYPNPVKDELFVNCHSLTGKTEIKIMDVLGKEIYRNVFEISNLKLQTSNYKPGIYFIEINDGKNIDRKKFLKE